MMTYGEALEFISLYMVGDNIETVPSKLHFKAALYEVAMRCEPQSLIADLTDDSTDVFRVIHDEKYIKHPMFPTQEISEIADQQIPIDDALFFAVVYFVCSYLSKKASSDNPLYEKKSIFEQRAERVISVYNSNIVG